MTVPDSFRWTAARRVPDDPLPPVVFARLLWHGLRERATLRRLQRDADQVLARAPRVGELDDARLAERLADYRHRMRVGALARQREALLEALALLRELSRRTLGIEPYAVQIVSVLAMLDRHLVQLAPGEGKTLTIGLLAALHGWSGRPCHVITANDYLAERDATELKPFFDACGLPVGNVLQSMSQDEKREQYRAAVVYSTVKQLLADYLTDQITFGGPVDRVSLAMRAVQGQASASLLMRGLDVAIVDEADNVLIDEAITPMIISGPDDDAHLHEATLIARELCDRIESGRHYRLDTMHREVKWTEEGRRCIVDLASALPALWRGKARREDLLSKAVLARDYFLPDQHYVVLDDEVVIVDEGTGRAMPGRSWSYGLHQAVEAHAGVPLTDPRKTLARLSFQNYFKLYRVLMGASGTLQNIAYELEFNYRTPTLRVPSRLPSCLRVQRFQVFPNVSAKLNAVVELTARLCAESKPVLIGTRTIEGSEALSARLTEAGIEHQLLNAKKLAEEAAIVARAGELGRVTVATNMAGRGTDIKIADDVLECGGLRVLMLEPHESARVDWQLFGRAGRQGNPGEVFPLVSIEDDLLRKHLPLWLRPILNRVAVEVLPALLWSAIVRFAQRRAQARAFSIRRFMNDSTREHRKRMTFTRYD